MGTFTKYRLWIVAAAMMAFASGARADTPMCDEVVADPTIVTCTCICEDEGSKFAGCTGTDESGAAVQPPVPTPNQCPDMLQGRRVISGGDALAAANPHAAGSDTDSRMLIYATENDSGNPGLGTIVPAPVSTIDPTVPCEGFSDQPFPQQTRYARLFDLPFDMVVTVRPTTEAGDLNADCTLASGADTNLVIDVRNQNIGAPVVPEFAFERSPQWVQLAIDDFNYDGFDDILFVNRTDLSLFTAVDTSDPTKGLKQVAFVGTTLPSGAFQAPINEPTTGDFNGDGLLEAAWIGGDFPNKTGTLSVFFATVCPGDVDATICEGAQPFEVILDPASKLFPGVSGATSTIVLDDAPTTPTACGVVQSPGAGNSTNSIKSDVLRAGTVVLGNFEDNGLNSRGAPTGELVVAYVSGSAASSSDPCSTDVQYWSFSAPPHSKPTGANEDSWALQRGDTIKNLFPDASEAFEFNTGQGILFFPPTNAVYSQSSYLDWYGTVEQAVIGVSGIRFLGPNTVHQIASAESGRFPIVVSVNGSGDDATISACSAPNSATDTVAPFAWGLAVGRFSTSTTINPDIPDACSDFAKAAPGDCPYNPQIAMIALKDTGNPQSDGPDVNLYTVQPSEPGTGGLECANDKTVSGFLPKVFKSPNIDGFSPMNVTSLRAGSVLRAGDAFGNSVRVGNPKITRIDLHTQPQMVIQAPPSLIDYVQPNEQDSATPAIVNFTRASGNFNTTVQFETTQKATSAASQTTSHSTSFTETVGGEAKFGVPLVSSIDAKNKESWSQFHESNTSSQFSNYLATGLETGGMIGVDDQVFWTQTTFNVFHFPVIGETVCPASLTCDVSDPNDIVCDAGGSTANAVDLTCAESGGGCQCLSDGASASLCPAVPSDPDARSCSEQGNDVCCSQLQQQLYMSLSGPEQVVNTSQQGATAEFYHPEHEPGQILSYPSGLTLLEARLSNPQELAALDAFSTGTNDLSETITYSSSCMASQGTGSTTRHTFDTATSLTFGTPKLAEAEEGVNVTSSFDYNSSSATSTLNSYTVGQTSSSSVQLNLQGSGFLNPNQYAYDVAGIVYGQVKPEAVLDTPDLTVCPINDSSKDSALCPDAEKQAAGCTTTGPLQVGYAADPTAGDGIWWSSNPAYEQSVDVAFNNPARWFSVPPDKVADADLQCRGDINGATTCYTNNQPPTKTDASSVWDADFFDMKGLLVTNGDTSGPQRDTAEVGDTIFLRARVNNYSLAGTAAKYPGSTVYARFYRQQLDVTPVEGTKDKFSVVGYATDANGTPLPAVPIGPKGLGDSDPIEVISPAGDVGSIPGFNTSTDPTLDNISIATTSYAVSADDACEFDNGTQVCNGAYYAYWVTAWIEDAGGNVLAELPGHGLQTSGRGAFNPATAYDFITDVPLETVTFNRTSTSFSNNVAMFKKVFTILPASDGAVADVRPGELMLDLLNVAPEKTVLGEPVVVSAQVVSLGAATPGATVVFTDGDPLNGGTTFDAEWLPHIRADDVHFVRVNYNPETCGTHEIFVEVSGGARALGAEQIAVVDVGIDVDSAIGFLISEVEGLTLHFPGNAGAAQKRNLVRELRQADAAFVADRTDKGVFRLEKFNDDVAALDGKGRIDPRKAAFLIAQSDQIIGCVR